MLAQGLRGLADLALAAQEHQDVAAALPRQLVHRVDDGLLQGLVPLAGAGLRRGAVTELHRVGAAGDLDDRRPAEVLGEALGVDGGRGDDQLEVRALRQQLLQVAEQEIDIEAALVGLVDDQGVILVQIAIVLDLRQQHAVGHQLDRGARLHAIMEAHLVADGGAQFGAEFLRHPAGQAARGDAPGLRVADAPEDAATQPQACVQTDLRQLGGLAGAGLAAEHDHLMVADQRSHLVAALANRQLRRIVDQWDAGAPLLDHRARGRDGLDHPREAAIHRLAVALAPPQPAQPPSQFDLISDQTTGQIKIRDRVQAGLRCLALGSCGWDSGRFRLGHGVSCVVGDIRPRLSGRAIIADQRLASQSRIGRPTRPVRRWKPSCRHMWR